MYSYLPTGRQAQHQQQYLFPEHQQQQRQSAGLAYRLGGGSRSGVDLRSMAAQESDDIDDILCNLWPTSRGEPCAIGGSPFLVMTHPMAAHQQQQLWQRPADGQHTPPEDTGGQAMSAMLPQQRSYPLAHAASDAPAAYAVVATGSPTQAFHKPTQMQYQAHVRGSSGRAVSAAIQIGDPEWRVDSPQSMRTSSPQLAPLSTSTSTGSAGSARAGHGRGAAKMPSPTSPAALPGWQSPALQDGADEAAAAGRGQAMSLGLGPAVRARPAVRCVTLGAQQTGRRLVTPEERAARLSAVSGLAARAVARRCLSGQIPQVDADVMLRQAGAPYAAAAVAAASSRRPTFADIARGTHD
ncbi:hypothetical protein LPJ53_001257 [Coemansia erecta]|uniref:Uncharacterized protein n=1 Tax=Coemansia erecta TaxID=147472 RepID=A0A9W7Y629_9FUNG|nr:hypothetical protein LPJ53_001257 [Coemansia erecta]